MRDFLLHVGGIVLEQFLRDTAFDQGRRLRARDKEDVRAVLGVQAGKLDRSYIEGWCPQHRTRERLEEIRRTVPNV